MEEIDQLREINYYMKINYTDLILEQLDCFKDLGVIFDNKLSFQHALL